MVTACRLLTADDAEAFRAIWLRSLKEHPDAFCEDHGEVLRQPLEWFSEKLSSNCIAGGFLDGALIGMSGLHRESGVKRRHRGEIWGVYVVPEARGHGVARQMIEHLIAKAKELGIEQLQISTNVTNQMTIAFYETMGFKAWGVHERLLKFPDGYADAAVMAKLL